MIMEKLCIEHLPETKLTPGAKRWQEEKGEFVQITYREEIRHLAFFELKEGFWRGSHVHRTKREVFYVLDGVMRGLFVDMATGERAEYLLGKGAKVRIEPGLAHILYGVEDARVVEYASEYYDEKDAMSVDFSTPGIPKER
jgi:dTDP-4-dehydrorhamnose 3,5-epimerase-like enzyme